MGCAVDAIELVLVLVSWLPLEDASGELLAGRGPLEVDLGVGKAFLLPGITMKVSRKLRVGLGDKHGI